MPSLEGAQAWFDRTKEHLQELQAICSALAEAECEAIIVDMGLDPPDDIQALSFKESAAPVRVSVLVGEAIQAMRRSLDYLIYEVAWLDSGSIQNDTQFPIEDSPDTFERRRKRTRPGCYLIGVSDEHAAAIKLLQPFDGAEWTKTLRTLSNPDKHRHLTVAKHTNRSIPLELPLISKTNVHLTGPARRTVTRVAPDTVGVLIEMLPPNEMSMQLHITPHVAFEDGSLVVEILNNLKAEVTNVLEDFRPCFGGHCHH